MKSTTTTTLLLANIDTYKRQQKRIECACYIIYNIKLVRFNRISLSYVRAKAIIEIKVGDNFAYLSKGREVLKYHGESLRCIECECLRSHMVSDDIRSLRLLNRRTRPSLIWRFILRSVEL